MKEILNFLEISIKKSQEFVKSKIIKNTNYVIEISNLNNIENIISDIKSSNFFNSFDEKIISRNYSKDNEYKKINDIYYKSKKFFETENILLQNNIILNGYTEKIEYIDIKNWGDDEDNEYKEDYKTKFILNSKTHKNYFFNKEYLTLNLYNNKAEITFKNINIDFIYSSLSFILLKIYTDFDFILTLEKELEIKNNTKFKAIKEYQTIFNFEYLKEKKEGYLKVIKNYYFSLPSILFNIDKDVYILDSYDNLRQVNYEFKDGVFEEVLEEGFYYPNKKYLSDIENENNEAYMYYDIYTRKYQIYTKCHNIYRDKIIDGAFYRLNNSLKFKDNINIKFFILSNYAMSENYLKEINKIIHFFESEYILKRVCKKIDIDFLLNLSTKYRNIIIKEFNKYKKEDWIALYFYKFLTISYDETNSILFELNDEIEIQNKFIKKVNLNLEQELENEKLKIYDFYQNDKNKNKFYNDCLKLLDQFKFYSKDIERNIHIKGSITNAWMKCWEMIITFDLVPKDHSKDFTIFCNAEFPGAFILALNHYIKTLTKNKDYIWYANSLWPDSSVSSNKEIFKDHFKLYEKHRSNWLMNSQNRGNVTDINMIKIIKDKLKNKVDLYTSDIGIGIEQNQEEEETILNLGQIICGLETLKNGGIMVCKMFSFFKPFNISLLKLLSSVFDIFYISKPLSSRPSSSEIYIIGKGYNSNPLITEKLYDCLLNWDKDIINKFIEPINIDFYMKLIYILYYIYKRQLLYLKKNMDFVNSMYKISTDLKDVNLSTVKKAGKIKEIEDRQIMVNNWKKMFIVPKLPKEYDLI